MQIPLERKIVTIALAAFVAFTTITNAVVVKSPQHVLNAGTVLKADLKMKDVAMQPPQAGWLLATGVFFAACFYAIGPDCFVAQEGGEVAGYVNVYRMAPGPPYSSNPVSPDTVSLIQDLP